MATKRGLDEDRVGGELPSYVQVLRWKDQSGQTKEMVFPKALDLDRPKRPRTTFSEEQLGVLEAEFARSQYLVGTERSRLASELQLSETQIKVWFQNRRTKLKRDKPSEGSGPKSRHSSDSEVEQAASDPLHSLPQPQLLKLNPLLFPFTLPSFPNDQVSSSPWFNH